MRRWCVKLLVILSVCILIVQLSLFYGGQEMEHTALLADHMDVIEESVRIRSYSAFITKRHIGVSSVAIAELVNSTYTHGKNTMPKVAITKRNNFLRKNISRIQNISENENIFFITRPNFINEVRKIPFSSALGITYWRHKFAMAYNRASQQNWTIPLWQKHLRSRLQNNSGKKAHYFLTHLLMVRLYPNDPAKWTIRELKQWIHYMLLAGVEHIYICDHFHNGDKNMADDLEQYIHLGLLSYVRIHTRLAMQAQLECYRKWVKHVGEKSEWMTSVDMDEYPFHMTDGEEGFLHRYLKHCLVEFPDVAEMSMANYLMLGQGDRSKGLVVDRIRRSTPHPANKLVKPLFQPSHVMPGIHRGLLLHAMERKVADPEELRMLHYWGGRLQNWGPDTEEMYNTTRKFTKMADTWAIKLRTSLLCFGENDAFSNTTGP